ILLVVESERDISLVVEHLFRIGYDNLAGYLHDGMTSWQNAGLPLQRLGEWTVKELNQHKEDANLTVLDVRSQGEYKNGYVPGAKHIYVPHLEEHLDKLDKNQTVATYCGSGYRASIAASILQKHGFEKVINIPGSWIAWKSENLPVEKPV
ncbi:MAG: rhodanese-like domain-containing protein, partial [Rivularia sp. (in: cyanobacteria)]